MNIKLLTAGLGLALSLGAINANAQKVYTSGAISYPTEVRGQPADGVTYFTPDSAAAIVTFGAGTFKVLTTANHKYLAVILDIPVAGIKKAGIATPAELEEGAAAYPIFTFTPTTEAKKISGFNCTKVTAKDTKSGKSYDVWVTKDISVSPTAILFYYKGLDGFPVQYTVFQQGEEINVTVKSVTDAKAPAGTYGIASDIEKGTMAELMPGQ